MADEVFDHPRLIGISDALEPDREDLRAYLDIASEVQARGVLDVGCGTGVFALLLADRGVTVTGVDPAEGSLAVARAKPGAQRVTWIHGDATTLPRLQVDLATMTGNVAQAITGRSAWLGTLTGVFASLRPGGRLVFETRDPDKRAWEQWSREASLTTSWIEGVGSVEHWVDVRQVRGSLVSFRWTWVFASDGAVLTSDSTLRFRTRQEVEADLAACGYRVDEIREAPDRPGMEFVFIARRPQAGPADLAPPE